MDCSEKYCVSCFMSFHQKGALKKHTTQTVEQVCLVSITALISVLFCVSFCLELKVAKLCMFIDLIPFTDFATNVKYFCLIV